MKILMINKFLHPNGGSETYTFKLGEYLETIGHEVQYFGMEHPDRCVGNNTGAYVSNMDFHNGSKLKKITYPIKTVYSREACIQLRKVLDDFCPDVCHLNNFNYQLTPSIIQEIRKWEKDKKHSCKIVYTAHDGQLVCPNHLMKNPNTDELCEKCLGGHYLNCIKGRCIHGSLAKSVVGAMEAMFWNFMGVYRELDTIICCSEFMKTKLDTNTVLASKTVALHNFIEPQKLEYTDKKDYVLYFGRYSQEKGIGTLLKAAKKLPDIQFVFAGSGPLENQIQEVHNIRDMGFQTGESLARLIHEARFTVVPSECYENCPFSVMESQAYGTPVLGARIGGIPELIKEGCTGELFESGNAEMLTEKIRMLWNDCEKTAEYANNCKMCSFDNMEKYTDRLMHFYR